VPARPEELIVVGEISRVHGLRGEVLVAPVTDFPDHLLTLDEAVVVSGGTATAVRVEAARTFRTGVLMKFSGIDSRPAAERLRGATVRIPAAKTIPLPAGEFYVFDIVGLEVRTPEGERVGEVTDVLRTGSNDVYVVRPAQGPEILLPAVDTCICEVDVPGGRLVARLPEWMT
jgi:16S rRNA processing protein RimM